MTLNYTRNSSGNYDIFDENNVVIAQTVFMPRAEEFIRLLEATEKMKWHLKATLEAYDADVIKLNEKYTNATVIAKGFLDIQVLLNSLG